MTLALMFGVMNSFNIFSHENYAHEEVLIKRTCTMTLENFIVSKKNVVPSYTKHLEYASICLKNGWGGVTNCIPAKEGSSNIVLFGKELTTVINQMITTQNGKFTKTIGANKSTKETFVNFLSNNDVRIIIKPLHYVSLGDDSKIERNSEIAFLPKNQIIFYKYQLDSENHINYIPGNIDIRGNIGSEQHKFLIPTAPESSLKISVNICPNNSCTTFEKLPLTIKCHQKILTTSKK